MKVCLFTGCTGTLGTAFVNQFHSKYHIVGMARHSNDKIKNKCHLIQGDINFDYPYLVDHALKEYGKVDLIVNAAVLYNLNPLFDQVENSLARQFQTNVIAPFRLVRYAFENFWKHASDNQEQNRNVINISSISAKNFYGDYQASYATSKTALNRLSNFMGNILYPYGVRVNVIMPNSFPNIVSTESVAVKIHQIDSVDCHNMEVIIDANR